jgi:Tfp pilus assembly protein PilX
MHPCKAAERLKGYALPMVLLVALVIAAFCAASLEEAVTNRTISNAHLAQHRAFNAAATGLQRAITDLQAGPVAVQSREYPLEAPDRVRVETRATQRNPLPSGFSAGRFSEQFYELTSTGRSVRGALSVQVQALRRLEPDGVATSIPEPAP